VAFSCLVGFHVRRIEGAAFLLRVGFAEVALFRGIDSGDEAGDCHEGGDAEGVADHDSLFCVECPCDVLLIVIEERSNRKVRY